MGVISRETGGGTGRGTDTVSREGMADSSAGVPVPVPVASPSTHSRDSSLIN